MEMVRKYQWRDPSLAAAGSAAAAVIKIGNEKQIYVHFCCINLNIPFLIT